MRNIVKKIVAIMLTVGFCITSIPSAAIASGDMDPIETVGMMESPLENTGDEILYDQNLPDESIPTDTLAEGPIEPPVENQKLTEQPIIEESLPETDSILPDENAASASDNTAGVETAAIPGTTEISETPDHTNPEDTNPESINSDNTNPENTSPDSTTPELYESEKQEEYQGESHSQDGEMNEIDSTTGEGSPEGENAETVETTETNENTGIVYSYEDPDVLVTATLNEEDRLPEGAEFHMVQLSPESEDEEERAAYSWAEDLLNQFLSENELFAVHLIYYDLYFEVDGSRISVDKPVHINIEYKNHKEVDPNAGGFNMWFFRMDDTLDPEETKLNAIPALLEMDELGAIIQAEYDVEQYRYTPLIISMLENREEHEARLAAEGTGPGEEGNPYTGDETYIDEAGTAEDDIHAGNEDGGPEAGTMGDDSYTGDELSGYEAGAEEDLDVVTDPVLDENSEETSSENTIIFLEDPEDTEDTTDIDTDIDASADEVTVNVDVTDQDDNAEVDENTDGSEAAEDEKEAENKDEKNDEAEGESEAEAESEAEPEPESETEAEPESEAEDVDEDKEEEKVPSTRTYYASLKGDVSATVILTDPAQVPDSAEIVVTAVTPDASDYNYDAYIEALNNNPDSNITYTPENTLLYDISFIDYVYDEEGELVDTIVYEPAEGTVKVQLRFNDNQLSNEIKAENSEDVTVNHLVTDAEADTTAISAEEIAVDPVDANVNLTGIDSVSFSTESFSVYAFTYTVDFHYEINGQTVEFSIPGGGFVSLEHIVEVLGIARIGENSGTGMEDALIEVEETVGSINLNSLQVSEATKQFVADVASVEFSSPELVWVGKVDEDTTVGGLKEANGLEVQYSAELTEKQIAEINEIVVESGDWALISVLPFTSEESLTVTMKNGDQFVVKVTDAQLKKTVIDAKGDTWEITVTYGPEARIPDGVELVVNEILPEDEEYTDYLNDSVAKLGVDSSVGAFARFFDIEIQKDGEKIEPTASVQVAISLADTPAETSSETLKVVHFVETGVETIDEAQATQKEDESIELTFDAISFSVYGVIVEPIDNVETDLDGKTAKIGVGGSYLSSDTVYWPQGEQYSRQYNESNGSRRPWAIGKVSGIDQAAYYTFEATETPGVYAIYTLVNNEKNYIHINHTDNEDPNGNGSVNLSNTGPMGLTVTRESDGTYRISRTINGTTYYLNEHYGANGYGIASWYGGNDNNSKVALTFDTPILENNKEYMVIVKHNEDGVDKYYIVLNDGTLTSVEYNEEENSVTVDNPMLWYYTGDHLYHDSTQVGYNNQDLPSDSYYRYIDPSSATALSEDDASNTMNDGTATGSGAGPKITSRSLWNTTALTYTDNKLKSTSNPDYFIGVVREGSTLKLKGQESESEAATIFFADAVNVDPVGWQNHVVNHIDISIKGTAAADVPLAYGKYYDANHNVKLDITSFAKIHLTEDEVVDLDELEVTPEDMKRSTISAYLENGTNLNDMFYVSGYSANPVHEESTAQVRIEGAFKVANLDGTDYEVVNTTRYNNDETYRTAVHNARLNNRIHYSVTVIKPITFNLVCTESVADPNNPEETVIQKTQLYDADGNALTITADVAFSASFDYWDERNECPPIHDAAYGYHEQWQTGGIPDHNLSGMDFKLGADSETTAKVYAVEITKIVVDESGNRIKSTDAGTNKFYIYKNSDGVSAMNYDGAVTSYVQPDYDDVKDLDVGSFTQAPDYSGYVLQHEKSISVGNEGLGLVYDYDVQPGRYYVREDPTSIISQITDTSGKTWDYKNTYILTEYVWRNHANDNYMHVSGTFTKNTSGEYETADYSSIPEILGLHYGYNGDGPYTNDFLEFYVYNVYESPKVDVPVIKTWTDFADEQYNWQVSFKLQWAPLYAGEDRPSVSFQDVTPVQTMTINKSDMAGITQELITRYLSGDDTLTAEETARIEAITFQNLPKYGTDSNGTTFRYQYSLEETSYRVTNATTGVVLHSWSETDGYNDPDESTHYHPFYPHDAGETEEGNTAEQNEADTNYYIDVRNALRNISQKEYIDVSLDKQWDINDDDTFDTRDQTYWAEFELRRFVHMEYRDVSHMSDADRTADPITITIKNGDMIVHSLQVQPNVGLYLGGNFLPHNSDKSVTFAADHPVRLANDSRVSTLTATAEGHNMSNALVRTQEFFATQDTVFTIDSGAENLVTGNLARVLDTGTGTSPLPDRSYSQTIRLDSSNNWHVDLEDLIRSETSSGDDDDNENVIYYEYYLVEKNSNPKGYAQYFRADSNDITTVLSGDSDHQIEHDDSIIALNGPSNRLIVKKLWRGVPDTTGFPAVTFTLYQAWADGNEGWVYINDRGESYQNIELSGNSLEWICPETLPTTRLDGSTSRAVKYYVVEDERAGSETKDGITTSWKFYYYINSKGQQTNAGHQGYFAALNGLELASDGGTITICNEMDQYIQLDIQKQFFKMEESGSWNNVTASSEMMRNAVLGFKVIRAIKDPDGKWLDERGNESNTPVWMDYGEEMLCGYDENGNTVVHRGENDIFWLHNAGGDWHFRIEDNQGDATNVNAGGAGLPSYGFYIKNGEDIPVEYWYSVRETNVYKDLNRTPYPEWDWFSSITPVNAHGPNGQIMEAFPKAFHGQDAQRIANFQASDLIIDKEWIGDPAASAVYVKIWRTSGNGVPEDFTAIMAEDIRNNHNWQMYVNDPAEMDLNRNALIVKPDSTGIWEDAIKVNRALLGALSETGEYQYYIQEVGYRTLSGEYRTNVNGTFKPLYDKWVGTATEGAYTDAPVSMNDYAGNNITIGAKGENRLKVINSTAPSTSYSVTKAFHGPQSSTGGQSSVTGKYPTDGSKQVVVELQQRYRYEKTEDGVDYVSADHENWVRADSADAATTWTVDWQSAETVSPKRVTLPQDKPEGSILTDETWYGSAAAWTYIWEGLDVTKVVSDAADPEDSLIAQLYYRAVEVSTPDWFNSVIAAEEQNGHMAVDDSIQTSAQVLAEKSTITNERADCTLELNKEWTGLGTGTSWPTGYVVYYQLIQNFHLAVASLNGDTATYSYGDIIKSVDMVTSYSDGLTADSVHPQAVGTLEEANHNLTLKGLPLYGFFTATEEDAAVAAEMGVSLTAGTVYPVVYTYSVKETAVKKSGVDVDFTEQTVDFTEKTVDEQQTDGEDGQTSSEEQGTGSQTETTETGAVYEATLTNEMVSVDVTKTWANNDPYADSVTVKLYRTTEIPADQLCLTTINLSFGDNYSQITDSTITASIGGKTVNLVKDGDNDLWTGTVRLEKGTTPTISFTEPDVAEGYTVTLSESQLTVPDAETYTFNAAGIVAERQNGRTITVNVTWTDGNIHSATFNNLFYSGWGNTNISSVASTNGSTQTFVWSGVPTTGNSLFVQLGYNGYNLQNSYTVNVTGSGYSFNNISELLLGDIAAGDSNVTINVTIEEKEAPPEGTGSIALMNSAGYGIWINQLRNNEDYGNFGGWLNNGASNTINNLPAGEYTVQLGNATISQISGADSVVQWGDANNPNVNIHITLADGESRIITVNVPGNAGSLMRSTAAPRMRNMRLTGDVPVLAQSVTPSSVTVELGHEAVDTTLVTVGADEYPVFTQADLVEEQTLNAANSWHYQWTGLAARDPETGDKYYYYVVEEVPDNTKTVTYERTESNNNTVVTINNTPVVNPEYGSLKVSKAVVDEDNNALEISREFTIRLKQGDKYLKWTSSSGYEWIDSSDGATTWTFNNGGSVTFTGLETGKTYTVVEDTSTGMIEIDGYTFVSATSYEVTVSSATQQYEGTVTNTYKLNNIDLNIVKVDATDMQTFLKGAQFTLKKLDPAGKGSYLSGDDAVTKVSEVTDDEGTTSITDIGDGYYEISETKIPDGYILIDSGKIFIKIDKAVVSLLTKDPNKQVTEWTVRELVESDKLQFANETNTFTVGNTPGAALPNTGGPGTTIFYMIGLLLTSFAGTGILVKRRKRNTA